MTLSPLTDAELTAWQERLSSSHIEMWRFSREAVATIAALIPEVQALRQRVAEQDAELKHVTAECAALEAARDENAELCQQARQRVTTLEAEQAPLLRDLFESLRDRSALTVEQIEAALDRIGYIRQAANRSLASALHAALTGPKS